MAYTAAQITELRAEIASLETKYIALISGEKLQEARDEDGAASRRHQASPSQLRDLIRSKKIQLGLATGDGTLGPTGPLLPLFTS